MHELTEALRRRLPKLSNTRLIVLLGLSGMALILLSGLLPHKAAASPAAEASPAEITTASPEAYRAELEARLTALLSRMEGVGEVTVMITLGGSAEQVYAEEVKASRSENAAQTESAPVLTRSGGSETALLTETKYPPVQGAAILCTGGDHAAVKERVSNAAAAVLGIPSAQIYVGKASAYTN